MPPKESLDPPLLRQWKILRALSASRQGRTIRELQGDAQVSEKTVRRDLLTLAGAGFPLHERLADYGKKLWRIEARAGVPDFNITFDEALGLYLANRLLEPLAGSGFWESAQAAIQKIRVMLGDTAIRQPAAMANLLGDVWDQGEPRWEAALAIPGVHLHLYGKDDPRPGRKMGHLTVLAKTANHAIALVQQAKSAL